MVHCMLLCLQISLSVRFCHFHNGMDLFLPCFIFISVHLYRIRVRCNHLLFLSREYCVIIGESAILLLHLVLANKVMLSDFCRVQLILRLMSNLWGFWQQSVTKMFGLNFCRDFGHRLWRKPLQQEHKRVSLKMNEKMLRFCCRALP